MLPLSKWSPHCFQQHHHLAQTSIVSMTLLDPKLCCSPQQTLDSPSLILCTISNWARWWLSSFFLSDSASVVLFGSLALILSRLLIFLSLSKKSNLFSQACHPQIIVHMHASISFPPAPGAVDTVKESRTRQILSVQNPIIGCTPAPVYGQGSRNHTSMAKSY